MAEADCDLCRMAGYRSCDLCGDVVFERGPLLDLCPSCRQVTARTAGTAGGSR